MDARPDEPPLERRALVLAPTGRDAELARSALERAGIDAAVCADVDELCRGIAEGAGCAVVTEEALSREGLALLRDALANQPPWSDLPVVVFGAGRFRREDERGSGGVFDFGNVTNLERPVSVRTMVSAVRAGLRARSRQYDARRAIRERDSFLAMLGHELRNPLSAILLTTQLMERRDPGDALLRKQRETIDRQTRHLARLVDDLLEVSRVSAGKITLQRERLDVVSLVRRIVLEHRPRAVDSGICLSFDAEPGVVAVDADAIRLEQVFANLLTNAIKYTPPGGNVTVTATREGERAVVIQVRDDGVGLAPGMAMRVFDLFAQVDQTLDRARGGMGIGLTLVRSLVELHGGAVWAESEGLGKGSRFAVRLPALGGREAARAAVPDAAAGLPSVRRRVVVVEDSTDIREGMRQLLAVIGHEVEVAEDGPSGVRTVLAVRPDAAFIDIGLPGLSGYEVARRIRREIGAEILLIAITGYGQPGDQREAIGAGFDLHMTKPVDVRKLENLLRDGKSRHARH